MMKTFRLILALLVLSGLGYYLFRINLKLINEKALNAQLSEEKEQLRSYATDIENKIAELNTSLEEKETRLRELSNVQGIRTALTTAQERIDQLNKVFNQANSEKMALQDEKLNINNRLQNMNKELMRTTEELRNAKNELTNIDRIKVKDLRAQVDELDNLSKNKNTENIQLKKDLVQLQQEHKVLMDTTNALENKIKVLEAQNSAMREKSANLSKDSSGRQSSGSAELQDKINRLENELRASRQGTAKTTGSSDAGQYDTLRDQLRQVSELLVKKELELDKVKKDASDSGPALSKKTELIDSLQKNVDYLNQQLAKKEEEKKSVEANLSRLESQKAKTQEEVSKQKAHADEANLLYTSLRSQISQLQDILNDKDKELAQRQKDIATLKEDIENLKSHSDQLEDQLTQATQRQKKTLDDLSAAVRVNAVLQERLGSPGQSESGTKDRQSAYDLKKKVEVILEPEK